MQNLNLNAVRVFAIAGRFGNFQLAAQELNISHGAVSQRIKLLEQQLGVILFDRHARGVSLTPKGRQFHNSAEQALAVLTTATADLERSSRQITFHLGASFASKWLMPRRAAFAARFPAVVLATEIHETVLDRKLGRNEISIWPAKTALATTANDVRRLCELQLVAVCSPDFQKLSGALDLETILSLPLLQDAHHRWQKLIDNNGRTGTFDLLNFGRSALAIDAAIHGHGVVIAPTFMVEDDIRANRLIEIWRNPSASGEFMFLSWAKQYADEKPLKQAVNWVLTEFEVTRDNSNGPALAPNLPA